jgi:flavin-dependent thymidylate synthase
VSELIRKGDKAQYEAEPHTGSPDAGVLPKVTLISMNPDPLGSIAAMAAIYKGQVVRSLMDVNDDQRMQAFIDVQKTHLRAPLEAVKMHFLFEGVDRAFTHQHVRQRTAVYAQESMRFAVLGDLLDATTLPPSLAGTKRDDGLMASPRTEVQRMRKVWDDTLRSIDQAYHRLVRDGMPAEEARGLLPHCTATRIHYITDLRNLVDHAGNRLCTQAQFHWRLVFAGVVRAIKDYPIYYSGIKSTDFWQFTTIADSELFRPVCYQVGHCPFEASFDRPCTIRDRVQLGLWKEINPAEWLLDPSAARS